MQTVTSFADIPAVPGVYALYSGKGRARDVVYVGVSKNLKARLGHHFLRRDSSITTGASAVSLNPDKISEIVWWRHRRFRGKDAEQRLADWRGLCGNAGIPSNRAIELLEPELTRLPSST